MWHPANLLRMKMGPNRGYESRLGLQRDSENSTLLLDVTPTLPFGGCSPSQSSNWPVAFHCKENVAGGAVAASYPIPSLTALIPALTPFDENTDTNTDLEP
jgi:hypothetical protein